jgi:hypothetical protein
MSSCEVTMIGKIIPLEKIIESGYDSKEPYTLDGKQYVIFGCSELFYNKYIVCQILEPNSYKVMDIKYIRKNYGRD